MDASDVIIIGMRLQAAWNLLLLPIIVLLGCKPLGLELRSESGRRPLRRSLESRRAGHERRPGFFNSTTLLALASIASRCS